MKRAVVDLQLRETVNIAPLRVYPKCLFIGKLVNLL